MNDWKIFSLGDLAKIKYGKNQKKVQSDDGKFPIYGTGGLIGYANKFLYDKPSVLIGRKGSISKVKFIDKPFWTVDTLFYTEINESLAIPKFLYYSLSSIDLYHYNEGTTIPSLRTETLNKLEINLPPLETQKKIAAVLSSLDDKIELNNQINKNLEQQAQAIFKNYFVENFNSDWKEIYLSEIANFIGGYSYKGNELKISDTAMVTIKNFNRNGGFKLDGLKEIQPSAKLKIEHDINLFDVVVAHTDLTQNAEIIGNAENILSFGGYKKIIFSMDVVKVVPKNDKVSKFLLGEILRTKEFKNHCLGYVNGTTVLHLSKKALPEYKLFFPTDFSVLNEIDKIIFAVYEKISTNIEENLRLAEMRDLLLPKLLSGEIDVSAVEI